MANLFGGALKGFQEGRDFRRQGQQDSIDNAVKYAQLAEAGYRVQPVQQTGFKRVFGGPQYQVVQDPSIVGTKTLERQKLQTENELSQIKLNRLKGSGVFGQGANASVSPSGLVAKDYDEYGLPKSYYDPNQEIAQKRKEEELKQEFEAQKPLSDTASTRLSAAQQSLGNLQTLRNMATPEKFGQMKKGVSKIRVGNKLGVTNIESPVGNALNFMTMGAAKLPFKTNDEQKQFENNLSTLVESQLRARTGAAAPQTEVDREVSRILASDDSLDSFMKKLSNAEKFALGISEGIKPGSTARFGQPQAQEPVSNVPEWAAGKVDYEAAKQSGYSDEEIQKYLAGKGLL